jgi:hypothetical protein
MPCYFLIATKPKFFRKYKFLIVSKQKANEKA